MSEQTDFLVMRNLLKYKRIRKFMVDSGLASITLSNVQQFRLYALLSEKFIPYRPEEKWAKVRKIK